MVTDLMDLLFGCWHTRWSFPQKHRQLGYDYVVCLDCGEERQYNFTLMKMEPETTEYRPVGGF